MLLTNNYSTTIEQPSPLLISTQEYPPWFASSCVHGRLILPNRDMAFGHVLRLARNFLIGTWQTEVIIAPILGDGRAHVRLHAV